MSTSIELLTQCSIDILVQVLVFDTAFSSCDMRLAPNRIECYFMCYDDSMCWMFSYNPTLSQCCMAAGGAVAQETTSSQPGTHIYKVENARTRCSESSYLYSRSARLCFKVFSRIWGMLNWNSAKTECENQGASLIKLDSEQKQNAIRDYLGDDLTLIGNTYFIGGSKVNQVWRWLDGSGVAAKYNGWAPFNPHAFSANCLALVPQLLSVHKWDDVSCTLPLLYICEIPQ